MKKQKKDKGIIVLLLIGAIFMTVGFATYAGKLNINGTVGVKTSKWSISYDKNSYSETTGSVEAAEKSITETDYTFKTTLSKPGDFYEATVNVKNEGTFNAKLTKITMSSLTEAQQKYLKYTVTYDETTYTQTTDNLQLQLAASGTKALKVRVEYLQPDNSTDLPSTDTSVTISGSLEYGMAE